MERRRGCYNSTTVLFGLKGAACLVHGILAHFCIAAPIEKIVNAKLTYKAEWKCGRIQEWRLTAIEPSYLLLLCLDPMTFYRGDKPVLALIYREFDMKTALASAVEEWGLLQSYPKVCIGFCACFLRLGIRLTTRFIF